MGWGWGGEGRVFQKQVLKDTMYKPRGGGIRGGWWRWLGSGGVAGRKCRQLYSKDSKIKKEKQKKKEFKSVNASDTKDSRRQWPGEKQDV